VAWTSGLYGLYKTGHTTDFEDQIQSMQIENQPVEKAEVGQMIGIKVKNRVRGKDVVYKIVE
jgi:putative protease